MMALVLPGAVRLRRARKSALGKNPKAFGAVAFVLLAS